jgi:hypothetical protein
MRKISSLIKDPQFESSVKLVGIAFIYPIFWLLQTIVFRIDIRQSFVDITVFSYPSHNAADQAPLGSFVEYNSTFTKTGFCQRFYFPAAEGN